MKNKDELLIEVCKFLESEGYPPEESTDLILELGLKLSMFTSSEVAGVVYKAQASDSSKTYTMSIEAQSSTTKPDLTLVH